MDISVAIIVVTYQAGRYLEACLSSLCQQTHTAFEIVIIDNHSSDDTKKIIAAFQRRDVPLHLIENNSNLGFARANNIGIRYVQKQLQSDYLLLLNQDTVVEPDLLERLLYWADPDAAAVFGPKILIKKNRHIWWIGTRVYTLRDLFRTPRLALSCQIDKEQIDRSVPKEPVAVDAIVGCAVLIPPRALAEVGYLDERFFMYGEDLDYSLRLRKKGYGLYMVPEAVVYHDVNLEKEAVGLEDRTKILKRYLRYFIGNLKVLRKHFPPGYALVWLTRVPFAVLFELTRRILKI